jgi:iron complex outermembrane recepter protein
MHQRIKKQPASHFKRTTLAVLLAYSLNVWAAEVQFDIPAQTLDKALNVFAKQSGERIVFSTDLTEKIAAPAVKGALTAKQALERLLKGSGLMMVSTENGGFTVVKIPEVKAEHETLPEVSVSAEAQKESALGAIAGYVAKRGMTATKTDSAIVETPQSISVVTRDQMTMQAAQSIGEALRYTAGIMAESNGPDPRADTIGARGFSIGRDQYRDGLRNYAFSNQGGTVVEPYGLERVEVLRGPSSILYGQGNPGGLVNLVSKRPTDAPLHELGITLGQYERKQLNGDFSNALNHDGTWSYRLVGLVRDSDTQIDYVKDNRIYIAPSLTWRPSDFTTLTLLTDYQKNDRGQGYQAWPRVGSLVSGPYGTVATSRFLGEPGLDKYTQERYALGYQFEHIFNNTFTFRQSVRYQRMTTDAISTYLRALLADQRTITRETGGNEEDVDNLVADSHLQSKWSQGAFEHTVLVGMDNQRLNNHQRRTFSLAGTLDIYNPVYGVTPINLVESANIEQHQQQTGLYLQDQVKYDGKWVATLGGRKDWTRMETDNLRNASSSTQKDQAETWRAGLVYLADNGLAPYASYTQSFLPVIGTTFAGAAFKPETGEQYELGLRYQPQAQNSLYSAALFDLRRQNVTTQDIQNPSYQIQQGEVRSRGLELEMKTQVDAWSFIGNYTYLLPEITQSNNVSAGIPLQGKQPNHVAKHTAALWADYRLPAAFLEGVTIGAGVRYIGNRYGDDANTVKLPSYTLVDLALRYDLTGLGSAWKGWQFALNASNLFDKEYVATCGYYGDGCRWGYRRNVMGNLTYHW